MSKFLQIRTLTKILQIELIAKIEHGEPIGRRCFPGELIERQSVLPLVEMATSRRKMA